MFLAHVDRDAAHERDFAVHHKAGLFIQLDVALECSVGEETKFRQACSPGQLFGFCDQDFAKTFAKISV